MRAERARENSVMRIEPDLHNKAEVLTPEGAALGEAQREPSPLVRLLSRWPVVVIVVGALASVAWTVALAWLLVGLIL